MSDTVTWFKILKQSILSRVILRERQVAKKKQCKITYILKCTEQQHSAVHRSIYPQSTVNMQLKYEEYN